MNVLAIFYGTHVNIGLRANLKIIYDVYEITYNKVNYIYLKNIKNIRYF